MVQNLVYNLCESFTENIGGMIGVGKKPTPITYLTQWKIVGNSEVHGVSNLTSWKVSGNSVVQDGAIMSCGDLGQDGKYHVKISNGVTIYDIPLTEPLRKVNDVADTIELPSGTEGKALVTRNLSSILIGNASISSGNTNLADVKRKQFNDITAKPATSGNISDANILCCAFEVKSANQTYTRNKGISVDASGRIQIYDPDYNTTSDINNFKAAYADTEIIYELATPTTELIDVSPFPVSATDTYTSANVVPFSAFEHTENKEIWSCGEYNATDGKYHILVQPQGGSIVDIALTEPLRKYDNDNIDTIEFANRVAVITRKIASYNLSNVSIWNRWDTSVGKRLVSLNTVITDGILPQYNANVAKCLCAIYETSSWNNQNNSVKSIAISNTGQIGVYDPDYAEDKSKDAYIAHVQGIEILYLLSTPTTETIDAPQIAEADSYTCVISQGGKTVSWSSFETE